MRAQPPVPADHVTIEGLECECTCRCVMDKGGVKLHFTEINLRCAVRPNILKKLSIHLSHPFVFKLLKSIVQTGISKVQNKPF